MRRGRQNEFLNYVVRVYSKDKYDNVRTLVLTPLCFFWQVAVCNPMCLILFEWEAMTLLDHWRDGLERDIRLDNMYTAQRGTIYFKIEKGIEY